MLLTQREMRKIRGRDIALVLQSPVAAMNPALRIESQFREAWRAHSSVPWREARPEVLSLIGQTGLPDGAGFLSRVSPSGERGPGATSGDRNGGTP